MMSKVNTNFKNITPFTGWWIAKRVVGLEVYLVEGDAYEITHKTIGDNYGEQHTRYNNTRRSYHRLFCV